MARANLELQRMMREILWGDLEASGRRVAALNTAGVRGAVRRHLDPKRATLVVVGPGGSTQ
jgi:hypothetical protein